MTQTPSLFDSYNARHLDASIVGRGFIYNPILESVAKRQHSLLIGPRGSGKTTFLKMLTMRALAGWRDPRRRRFIRDLDFLAIYVPSDVSWNPDYRSPVSAGVPREMDEILTYSLFRAFTLYAVWDTINSLRPTQLPPDPEFRAVQEVASKIPFEDLADRLRVEWGLKSDFRGMRGLLDAINGRIEDIQFLIVKAATKRLTADQLHDDREIAGRLVFDDLRRFCDAIDDNGKFPFNWAVCFDELEIAPDSIKHQVLRGIRSLDQRLLIKCSSSPFDETFQARPRNQLDTREPMAGHDLTQISLTLAHQRDVQKFGELMFQAICRDRGLAPMRASDVLGASILDDHDGLEQDVSARDRRVRSPYSKGGALYEAFKSLSEKDPSFLEYLSLKGIDLERMSDLSEAQRAQFVRKIIGPVSVRSEFLASIDPRTGRPSGKLRKRSRKKVPDIYSGARALFAMCEGNPRWLIGILGPLVDLYRDEYKGRGVIKSWVQARQVEVAITQFLALLSSIKVEGIGPSTQSAINTIDRIGDFFESQFLVGRFNPEPIASFVVDDRVDVNTIRVIGRALNQGAFVLIPNRRAPSNPARTIRGERLRVSHLLAPLFRLPLVTGREVDLSTILERTHRLQSALLFDDLPEVDEQ